MAHLDFISVFDELNDEAEILKYKLYKNYKTKSDIDFSKPIMYESKLKMNNKKTGRMVTKHFQLCDKKLISYKISNHQILSPNAFYDLMNFYTLYYNEYPETGLFSFTLSKYGKYHEFFSENKSSIIQWMELLKLHCITSNFSETFEMQHKIGKGHFAKVFQVRRKKTSELYAAKIFTKDKTFDDEKNFIRKEVFILKKLPFHEKILKLFEIFEDNKQLVLIFELLPEGDLYAKLKSKQKFTELEISSILAQILRGIEFLHSNGVMHRDIKLDNILLSEIHPYIKIKIADFSLAEFLQNRSHPLNKCGTPGFMAPEIFVEENYDERCDIFSAGVILFILLSKITPFKGKDANEILENNKVCNIKYKRNSWENVSKSARKLTMLMLMKNPDHRIRISQIFQNEFVMNSSTYFSEINTFVSSNGKVKSNANVQDLIPDFSTQSNKTIPMTRNSKSKLSNNFGGEQNMLQLPGGLSSAASSQNNISDRTLIKSVNSMFLGNIKDCNNSSSYFSEIQSPSDFTDHKKSWNNTLNSAANTNLFSLGRPTLHTKTDKSLEEYSYFAISNIFMDENPVKELLRDLDSKTQKPHPAKAF